MEASTIPTRVAAPEQDVKPIVVQIDFEGTAVDESRVQSSMVIEAVGPETAIGVIKDHVYGFYTEPPTGKARVKEIRIKRAGDDLFT